MLHTYKPRAQLEVGSWLYCCTCCLYIINNTNTRTTHKNLFKMDLISSHSTPVFCFCLFLFVLAKSKTKNPDARRYIATQMDLDPIWLVRFLVCSQEQIPGESSRLSTYGPMVRTGRASHCTCLCSYHYRHIISLSGVHNVHNTPYVYTPSQRHRELMLSIIIRWHVMWRCSQVGTSRI